MGIRYLAISIDQQDFDHISQGTCAHCGEEPRLRDLDYEDDARRETLDLDKSWHYFQDVLDQQPTRPAAALVAGEVTNTHWGWRSHKGLLSPAEAVSIAADLATISADFVRQRLFIDRRRGYDDDERALQNVEYVNHYLIEAQAFTKRVAEQGRAILYYIG